MSQQGLFCTNHLQNGAGLSHFPQAHGAELLWSAGSSGVLASFRGQGNTCYLNAILQCLVHTPLLYQPRAQLFGRGRSTKGPAMDPAGLFSTSPPNRYPRVMGDMVYMVQCCQPPPPTNGHGSDKYPPPPCGCGLWSCGWVVVV